MKTVKNVIEKTVHQCHCGSWDEHLNIFGGNGQSRICAEASCMELVNVGTHVQLQGDCTWYMVALCMKHNRKDQVHFQIKENAKLALASVAVTCQKNFLKAN